MSHAEDRTVSELDAEAERLHATLRQLVLMKETGPKSAAWHRARVQMIWHIHRRLERSALAEAAAAHTTGHSHHELEPAA